MSQRLSGHSYRADSGRMLRSEAAKAAPASSARRTDYTIVHAGHQYRLGPISFWIAVGSLVVMAGWSLATGTYFAFHDDVLSRLRSEEHTSELQSHVNLVCRLLLEKKKQSRTRPSGCILAYTSVA